MPIYEFECDLCGQRNETFFGMNDEKVLKCLNCGSSMRRLFSLPALTGDARMTQGWNYFDYGLGQHVTSKADRDRKMKAKGLVEFAPDDLLQKTNQEADHIRREAGPRGEKRARREINKVFAEADRVRRDRIVEAELKPAFDKMEKEVRAYDGPTDE